MRLKNLMAILISLCLITSSYAQGWERHYHVDTVPIAQSINYTSDGGFLLASKYIHVYGGPMRPYLVKTNVHGDTLWTKKYAFMSGLSSAKQTTDGGYILVGDDHLFANNSAMSSSSSNIFLVKVDPNGDTLWTKIYSNGGTAEYAHDVQQTSDGGYIIAGSTNGVGAGGRDAYLIKTDVSGVVQWTQTYGGVSHEEVKSVEQTIDGGYILTGYTNSFGAGSKDVYVVKTDVSGVVQWTQTYGGVDDDDAEEIIQTVDGGYILAGYTRSFGASFYDIYVVKIDATGTIEWTQMYGGAGYQIGGSIIEGLNGGYLLTGTSSSDINVLKLNTTGGIEWTKDFTYGQSTGVEVVQTVDGYAVLGNTVYSTIENGKGHLDLLRMDSLGNTFTNYFKGNIFDDTSSNCLKEVGERNFEGIVVRAVGNRTWYGTTDSLGNYCIGVDTGSYIITIDEPIYWQACSNNIPVTFTNFYTNDTINFPLQAQVNCPLMQVDLSAPFIRTNFNGSNYYVNYCNNGTIDATNVSVEVIIDADLDILNASLPIASQVGNTLTFNLGTVNYGTCGNFYIRVRAKATAILGQTHCSQAHIYPDSLCLPNPWTGPIIDPSATCQNDSIAFKLENIGGGLFNSETYYVFEDHVIMRTGNTGNIPVSGAFDLTIPADTGKTYRISVPQNFGYPKLLGDSIASAAIEGCVPYLDGTFNTGFITQFSNGNSAPFIAVDCQPNRGSYDPNDKSAQPKGYEAPNYIYSYTDLDYKIRFQNTGTDTAFLVVIRDTISPLLDLTTLTMGASSHNYTWRLYGERILEITFENIMLPDSNVNEPASNGFVRYRIEQNDGNVVGDVIYNAADIYFDFNAPIRTNTTFHTIGENFVTIVLDQPKVLDQVVDVKVYPNPFTQQATIEVEGEEYEELQLHIYDVSGRIILEQQVYNNNRIELSRENLQPGVYFYQLLGDNDLISTGKIVVQ